MPEHPFARDEEDLDWGFDLHAERVFEDLYGKERYAPATHCLICSKPLEATLLCAACGDAEDMAA